MGERDLFQAVKDYTAKLYGSGIEAETVVIVLSDKRKLKIPIPRGELENKFDLAQRLNLEHPKHSPDFRSINWFGERYSFTPTQAAVVKILWQAWSEGVPEVGVAYLLENSGSEAARLPDLFRTHPAWKTLIVEGTTQGTYCLREP